MRVVYAEKMGGGAMIKFAPYRCWGWGQRDYPQHNWVAYFMINDVCIFSGIDRTKRTSTVNAAEDIIENISNNEIIHWSQRKWFDLLGPWGYPFQRAGEYKLALLELAYTDISRSGRSEHDILRDGESIYVVARHAREVCVKDWHFRGYNSRLEPLYSVFEQCAARAKPAVW